MLPETKLSSNKYLLEASRDASTWVEEFLVQWGPEHCTFEDALEKYYLGFDIESITRLESPIFSQDLLPFVATKRPTKEHRRSLRRPPLSTNCVVEFAPPPPRTSPHPLHHGRHTGSRRLPCEGIFIPTCPIHIGRHLTPPYSH